MLSVWPPGARTRRYNGPMRSPPDHADHLDAIRSNPDDESRWLALAGWLWDNGRDDEAAVVRVFWPTQGQHDRVRRAPGDDVGRRAPTPLAAGQDGQGDRGAAGRRKGRRGDALSGRPSSWLHCFMSVGRTRPNFSSRSRQPLSEIPGRKVSVACVRASRRSYSLGAITQINRVGRVLSPSGRRSCTEDVASKKPKCTKLMPGVIVTPVGENLRSLPQ